MFCKKERTAGFGSPFFVNEGVWGKMPYLNSSQFFTGIPPYSLISLHEKRYLQTFPQAWENVIFPTASAVSNGTSQSNVFS